VEVVKWIHLAQGRDHWKNLQNMGTNSEVT